MRKGLTIALSVILSLFIIGNFLTGNNNDNSIQAYLIAVQEGFGIEEDPTFIFEFDTGKQTVVDRITSTTGTSREIETNRAVLTVDNIDTYLYDDSDNLIEIESYIRSIDGEKFLIRLENNGLLSKGVYKLKVVWVVDEELYIEELEFVMN